MMKFKFGTNLLVDTEKEPFKSEGIRIGFYSAPGTRKSYTVAACVVEPFLDAGGTVVIFEPRSEWHTLKQRYGIVVVGGPFQDIPLAVKHAKIYAEAIVLQGISMVFDFSEIDEVDLVPFTAELLARIYTLENVTRRPILIVPEETSEYCPFTTKGKMVPPWIYDRMTGRLVKLATQGRPLGIMMVVISQRPAQLNFTVRMMCNLSLYGKFHPKDLTDIEDVLSAYSKKIPNIKALANRCVNMPHGEWIAITGEGATEITIDARRKTPHGADTPTLTTTAPLTKETQQTLQDLSKSVLELLQQEQIEKSDTEKLERKVKEFEHVLTEKDKKIGELESALNVASRLEIKAPESKVDEEAVRQKVAFELREKVLGIFESYNVQTPSRKNDKLTDDTAEMWLRKLPTPCSKNIFSFLIKHKGMKFTRSQLALQTGYASGGGTFGGALSLLKKNNLIKTDGELWWVE